MRQPALHEPRRPGLVVFAEPVPRAALSTCRQRRHGGTNATATGSHDRSAGASRTGYDEGNGTRRAAAHAAGPLRGQPAPAQGDRVVGRGITTSREPGRAPLAPGDG